MSVFVAIDFETPSVRRDSACSVGVAAGCAGRFVLSRTYLFRPPSGQFTFTGLHGLRRGMFAMRRPPPSCDRHSVPGSPKRRRPMAGSPAG